MRVRKKIISMLLAIVMISSLTGCGMIKDVFSKIPTTSSMSLTLNVETGDAIKITMDTSTGYKMTFDNNESMFNIYEKESENSDPIMQGIFMTTDSFNEYYNIVYSLTHGNVVGTGSNDTMKYTILVYDDEEMENPTSEFMGWVKGSNTGVVFESMVLPTKTAEDIFKLLTFEVESTEQSDKDYIVEPYTNAINTPLEEPSTTPSTTPSMEPSNEPSNEPSDVPPDTPSIVDEPSQDNGDGNENGDAIDWTKLDIKIDGVTYSYPYSYKDLQKAGWSFKLEDYGYQDGYELDVNEYTFSTIDLHSEKYGTSYNDSQLSVGFQNFTDKKQSILDCDIWAIGVRAVYGSTKAEKIPNVELAGGIKLGSTLDEIIAVYGEPESTYEGTYYTQLDYQNNYSQYMKLYVYHDYGLMEIDLKYYN